MSHSRYIIGIDLGTTNCVVSYVDTRGRARPGAEIKPFEVPQFIAAGEMAARAMLPSFLYLPGEHELPAGATALPWDPESRRVVGEFARIQGARVPSRLVSSAKSWLCHAGVDREAAILPWGAPEGIPRVSPVEASQAYLAHIRDAWDWTIARGEETRTFVKQEIVLTVPASFDEAARELTVSAARRAGYEKLTLLEEPQAAFYAWIVAHQDGWQRELRAGELILVCDIGGGTTDFSLIRVVETPEGPGFRRVSVGDHLMLGGDNIDLALAHRVEKKLGGTHLDTEQWNALRYSCRQAKEKLLEERSQEGRWSVSIPGRGSRVIGGAIQTELLREEMLDVVLNGFFPRSGANEPPQQASRSGLQEFGLPFVADPAIPRHLNAFLRSHAADVAPAGLEVAAGGLIRPDAILFNGGALTPALLRERLVDVLASWYAGSDGRGSGTETNWKPRVLTSASLDLAVSIGAAYYGVVRRGGGIRIGGGTARSFYVGLDEGTTAKPWLCVVPRDAQEGDQIAIEQHDFELLMGRPVSFPLASSSVRGGDRPGDLVADDRDTLLRLPPLVGLMKVGRKAKAERVPVRLEANVTEVGTIELWAHSRTDERRWRLQIQFRIPAGRGGDGGGGAVLGGPLEAGAGVVLEQEVLERAMAAVRDALAAPGTVGSHEERAPARLVKRLEQVMEAGREEWPPSALRALWEPLREGMEARLKSPQHESRWLNLAGFCLRPGTGYPLDAQRIKAIWPIFHVGLKHQKEVQCWVEWWVLWRRIAAGLGRSHHEEIYRRLAPFLVPSRGGSGGVKKTGRMKPEAHELAQMWRCAGSLERLDAGIKTVLGDALAGELRRPAPGSHVFWSLGRLGARRLLYGPANACVASDAAARWLEKILEAGEPALRTTSDAMFAIASLARISGDRARDLSPDLRQRAIEMLEKLGADAGLIMPVRTLQEMGTAQEGQALGDALPIGLRLRSEGESVPGEAMTTGSE
jgi:hypothetical protein